MDIPNDCGIGLRNPHYQYILAEKPNIPWLEVHSENFFNTNSILAKQLLKIREYYPLSMHGVGLSLGSSNGVSTTHLNLLKQTITIYQPSLISEHLSWSVVDNKYFNDLLPLPYTKESLINFADNVKKTQDYLNRQILIENPSTYISFAQQDMPEWEFYAQLPSITGCGLLFDVNNIVVNGHNHSFNPNQYLKVINKDDVYEIHLAGAKINSYENRQIMIDNHGSKVSAKVWDLYQQTLDYFGKKPTLIEWDTNIPKISVLLNEAQKAQTKLDEIKTTTTTIC